MIAQTFSGFVQLAAVGAVEAACFNVTRFHMTFQMAFGLGGLATDFTCPEPLHVLVYVLLYQRIQF